jgi:anti-sigma factor RsiW
MNGKFEDKLVNLAFGETGSKESSALERLAQTDPEAAKTLAEYRNVRIGLNLLSDIPPDQLSKERLRNAILGQGLKPLPAPSPSRWGWTWMPATAFALVFGFLTIRHMNPRVPEVASVSPSDVAIKLSDTKRHAIEFEPKAMSRSEAARVAVNTKKPVETVARLASKRQSKKSADHGAFLVQNLEKARQGAGSVLTVASRAKPAQPPSGDKSGSAVDPATDNAAKLASINTPLVVINPENDNNSGAQKATVVDGASNLSVGG